MRTATIQSTAEKYIISVDRALIDSTLLADMMNKLRVEQLIEKADFDENILDIGRDIKKSWRSKYEKEFLQAAKKVTDENSG